MWMNCIEASGSGDWRTRLKFAAGEIQAAKNGVCIDGGTIYTRPTDQFMASWGALGKQAVIHSPS